MITKDHARLVFLVFGLLLLVACGPAISEPTAEIFTAVAPTEITTNTSITPPSGAFDACALITQAEAESVLGAAPRPGEPEDTPPIYSCSYETANFDMVQVVVAIYDDNAQALAAYEMAIEINGYPELSDLGDRAYNAQPIFDVNVLIGNIEISIDVSDSTDDDTQLQNAIKLAQLALDRLP